MACGASALPPVVVGRLMRWLYRRYDALLHRLPLPADLALALILAVAAAFLWGRVLRA